MSSDRAYWIDYTESKTPQDVDSSASVLFTFCSVHSHLLSYDLEDFYYYTPI